MSFQIREEYNSLRWLNWQTFVSVDSAIKKPIHKTLVVFVTHNSSEAALNTMSQILTGSFNSDILVIDNHSDLLHYNPLLDYCRGKEELSLIRTTQNLGGGGGYSIALEYFLSVKNYESVIVTEDDVQLLQSNNEALVLNESDLVQIWYLNNESFSFSFHYSKYSRNLLELAGVPDPRYFMIIDDLEFDFRIRYWLKEHGLVEQYLDELKYVHPVLKPFNSCWSEYFKVRNETVYYTARGKFIKMLFRLTGYLFYALSKLTLFGDFSSLKVYLLAIRDLWNQPKLSLENNTVALRKINNITVKSPLKYDEFILSKDIPYNAFTVGSVLRSLNATESLGGVLMKRPFVSGYGSPYLFLMAFFPYIYLVNNIEMQSNELQYMKVKIGLGNRLSWIIVPFVVILTFPFLVLLILKRVRKNER